MSPTNTKTRHINYLYALRRNRAYLQKHLATLLGHGSVTMVSQYERGTTLPPLKTAILLEIVLGARLSEIYVDLYRELRELALRRAVKLGPLARSLRSRIRRKD